MPSNSILNIKKDGEWIEIPALKGEDGFSPTATVEKVGKVATITITDINGTTTATIADGTGSGGSGEENTIESISVNGTPISIDENKNVDIKVPKVTNDLTDELKSSYDEAVAAKHTHDNKTVLDGITAEKVESWDKAEENIQSDWNETDDTADGFIKNKPTIPDITGLATETYIDNKVADYTKTADLADVATSGSYNDLADKPTIPSLDGYAKISEIPSKVSELENDSNYLSSIPEEYVTETELEAKGYLTEHQDISGKVDKVEGKSLISDTEIARLATVDNYDDTAIKAEIAKKADTTSIPSKVSELTNDSNYQTAEQVNSTVATEITKVVADAPESLNTLKEMSDWIAGHEDDASAMNSAISDNKTAITALQTGKADASDLTAHTDNADIHVTAENKATWNTVSDKVDKETGKSLLADTDKANYDDAVSKAHTHDNKSVLDGITSDKVTAWDNKSDFSGNYLDLNNKPTIPKPDGTTITIDEDGTLHGANTYELPKATIEVLGGIKPDGKTTFVNEEGILSAKGGGATIAPKPTVNPQIKNDDKKVVITWEDPTDLIYDDVTLSKWAGTKLVMKESGYPTSPDDGTLLVDNTTRNKYKTTGFTKSGLTNDKQYYFALFPYSTDGVYNYDSGNRLLGEPTELKIVTFATGTDKEISKMIEAHYNNKINIADYWAVGDMRTVHLSAMAATGVGESHRAQDVQFVIGDFNHDDLATPINGHSKAAVTLLQKDCLMDASNASNPVNGTHNTENGYMNSTNTNAGGWKNCARRTWCNNVFFAALPSVWQSMVKTVNKKTSAGNDQSTIETVQDKVFLAAEIEIFGSTNYSFYGEGTQYQYYKNATANRYKMPKWTPNDNSNNYFMRSPVHGGSNWFCFVNYYGSNNTTNAGITLGIDPCLCI